MTSFFIEGSEEYKTYVQKIFFEKYNNKMKPSCYKGESHLFGTFFYCDKNVDIPKIPSLTFLIKSHNYNITLNYEDLFITIEDKLFFLVYISKKSLVWKIGYHIIKQLNIAFNQDKKKISFSKFKKSNNQKSSISNNNITDKINLISILFLILMIILSSFVYYCYDKIVEKQTKKKELKYKLMVEMKEVKDNV